jgi:PAS domain S-box-containing protein
MPFIHSAETFVQEQSQDKTHSFIFPIVYLAIIYFIAGRLGTLLALPPGYSTAIFPASGLALFAILQYGYKVWPGILIGSFLLNGSISVIAQDSPLIDFLPIGLSIGLGASGEALVGAYLFLRLTKSKDPFYQIKSIFTFIVFSAGASSLVSAICGTLTVTLSGISPWNQFNTTFLTWWLGDAIGILVITPMLLLFSSLPSKRFHTKLFAEGIFLVICLIVVCKIVFSGWLGDIHYPLAFLPFPFLVWAVFRFDKLGVITSILIVSTISIWETINGNGPFAISHEQNTSLLLVQTFLGVSTAMTLILYTDLSEKRRINDSLLRSEERLRKTEDFSRVMATHVGLDGRWLKVPSSLCKLLGYTKEELLGQEFRSVTHPEDFLAVWSQCQHLIRGEIKSFDLEKRYIRKDGEVVWVDLSCSIVQDDGEIPLHFLTYIRDITGRKKLEDTLRKYSQELEHRVKERTLALEQSNQDLEEFAYLASHDLQEPLRKITTFSDRLREKDHSLNDEASEYLERMQKAAYRMANYINDLLEYSRATRQPKHYLAISLNKIACQVLDDLSNQIKMNHATVNLEELPTLEVNPVHFPKLIQNLISNAIKYHREGVDPIVTLSSSFCEKTKQWIIKVSDNGIGIEERYFSRIFKPFERLHGKSDFEGSGIGLAICDKIVNRHHGAITVQSKPGQGTTFIVTLPEKQKHES